MFKGKKILFIGAHQDDLEIGCGGTMLKYQNSCEMHYLTITDSIIKNKKIIRGKNNIKKNFRQIKKKLNMKSFTNLNLKCNSLIFNEKLIVKILNIIEKIKPDLVFTHWPNDIHQDHCNIGRATMSAARHVENIFFYRSNFYLSNVPFKKNCFIDISNNFEDKIKLIKIYETELKRSSYDWLQQIKNLNSYDGQLINKKYAESFEINRILVS